MLLNPAYPTDFPSIAVGILADTLRGKGPEKAKVIHAAWIVAGWGLNHFAPDQEKVVVGDNLDMDSAEAQAEFLEGLCQQNANGVEVRGMVPWILLVKIAIRILTTLF